MVRKVSYREAELLDTDPFADDTRHRQKGLLLCCQDNATAAIVKLQGYCVLFLCRFAKARVVQQTHRDTLQHKHTQRQQRNVTELDASTLLKKLLGEKKTGQRRGQKRSVSKKHFCMPRSKAAEKRKACREGGKKIINSE